MGIHAWPPVSKSWRIRIGAGPKLGYCIPAGRCRQTVEGAKKMLDPNRSRSEKGIRMFPPQVRPGGAQESFTRTYPGGRVP